MSFNPVTNEWAAEHFVHLFDLMAILRTKLSLSVESSIPELIITEEIITENSTSDYFSAGCYDDETHKIEILSDLGFCDLFSIFHEIVHAHQRAYLTSKEGRKYVEKTPYDDRWFEHEADELAHVATIFLKDLLKEN